MKSLEALDFLDAVEIEPKCLQVNQELNSINFLDVIVSCIGLKLPNFNTFKFVK